MIIQTALKSALSLAIILFCSHIGRKYPSLAGLVATMPLTALLVLVWMRTDNTDNATLVEYTMSAIWGIIPSMAFYVAALICLRNRLSFGTALAISFAVWLAGACVHQKLLGGRKDPAKSAVPAIADIEDRAG